MNAITEETRYIITEEYPDGHEMAFNHFGPATESEFRDIAEAETIRDPNAKMATHQGTSWANILRVWDSSTYWNREQRLDQLFTEQYLPDDSGSTFRVEPIRDWMILVDDIGRETYAYGPYTPLDANDALARLNECYADTDIIVQALKLQQLEDGA